MQSSGELDVEGGGRSVDDKAMRQVQGVSPHLKVARYDASGDAGAPWSKSKVVEFWSLYAAGGQFPRSPPKKRRDNDNAAISTGH